MIAAIFARWTDFVGNVYALHIVPFIHFLVDVNFINLFTSSTEIC